jgi:dihydrolipoamide dehydrogenase
MAERQDLVVIGGGSGGFAAAIRAAQLGGKVTVVEERYVGGNCMNKACIPLTFLTTVGHVAEMIEDAGFFGIEVDEPTFDMTALHDRRELLIEGLRMGTEEQLSDYGVRLVEGRGRLLDRETVEAGGERIETDNVVVATGSVSATLPVEGAELPGVFDTDAAIELREIPPRIAIIGSYPWDLELAQYFNWLGSAVTLITETRQVLAFGDVRADRETSQRFAKRLHDSGVAVKRGARVEAIRQSDDETLTVVLAEGDEIPVDKVLAARRFPNSSGLGLREVGVAMDEGAVIVDERMATNVPGIYAIGDVTDGPMWSHKANAEGIVAGANAMGQDDAMDYETMPHCLHTWPPVAWVGLTQDEAEDRGLEVDIGKVPVAINPYAMILNQTEGAIKIIAERAYGRILGVHMIGPGALDLINVATVAMLAEATVHELMRFIPAHPSIGEALVDAAMDVEKRSLHLPQW